MTSASLLLYQRMYRGTTITITWY